VYDGQLNNDKKEGDGVMKYATGNIYTGRWKNNLRAGKGHYKCVKEESWMEG
jgi:hypothetical protein